MAQMSLNASVRYGLRLEVYHGGVMIAQGDGTCDVSAGFNFWLSIEEAEHLLPKLQEALAEAKALVRPPQDSGPES
jgi:hypothetical protein